MFVLALLICICLFASPVGDCTIRTECSSRQENGDGDGDDSSELESPGIRPVIPGARGFGVEGPIARNRSILRVTNTKGQGEGSLHAALLSAHENGGGIVVFETSGVIDVEAAFGNGYLVVEASNLWIAGQTAPEPGIFVRGGFLMYGRDFLVQHIGAYRSAKTQRECDTMSLHGTNRGAAPGRAVFDHVALWGANDGNLDIARYGGGSVTVQHSIIAAPMLGGHPKAVGHNFNSLIYGSSTGIARITMRNNLFSTARDRQPLSSMEELVMVNNVLYNREPLVGRYIYLRNAYQNRNSSKNSIVGNVFWDTSDEFARLPILLRPAGAKDGRFMPESRIYLADNYWNLTDPPVSDDPWGQLVYHSGIPRDPILVESAPVWNRGLIALPSGAVLEEVRKNVGPRPAQRIRFIEQLTAEMGRAPTHGFPKSLADIKGELLGLEENRRPFEEPTDPHGLEENGYTHLENLLFDMAREIEGR